MTDSHLTDNPYLLLTPGPLTTTKTVKEVMLKDWCTWDTDYNEIVQGIRKNLVSLATAKEGYTSVLMQGSGTFSVESTVTTAVPDNGKLLLLANGAYGQRIGQIAQRCGVKHRVQDSGELAAPDLGQLDEILKTDQAITHVAVVHCETTTGMLNPIQEIGEIVKAHGKIYFVDAMSSFGGIPMDIADIGIDYLVSSANKCIQGVPGFGFCIAQSAVLEATQGNARSLSLDLYDQWKCMEDNAGKWRFTSPTHTVRAFAQAMSELDQEGGIAQRFARYSENHRILVSGMAELGFETILAPENQSPIITAFYSPTHPDYSFDRFYSILKSKGFVIYPGKVTELNTFRIGNIGDIMPANMEALIGCVKEAMYWA
jgi:2-aminoethylphosphonate-pyruvate transaminase